MFCSLLVPRIQFLYYLAIFTHYSLQLIIQKCKHFRPPPFPDSIVPYGANDSPSGFMSLQNIEDMNILVDVDFSSDDELPDLI